MNEAGNDGTEQFKTVHQIFATVITEAQLGVLTQTLAELRAKDGKESVPTVLNGIHQEIFEKANARLAEVADKDHHTASVLAQLLDQWKKSRQS